MSFSRIYFSGLAYAYLLPALFGERQRTEPERSVPIRAQWLASSHVYPPKKRRKQRINHEDTLYTARPSSVFPSDEIREVARARSSPPPVFVIAGSRETGSCG